MKYNSYWIWKEVGKKSWRWSVYSWTIPVFPVSSLKRRLGSCHKEDKCDWQPTKFPTDGGSSPREERGKKKKRRAYSGELVVNRLNGRVERAANLNHRQFRAPPIRSLWGILRFRFPSRVFPFPLPFQTLRSNRGFVSFFWKQDSFWVFAEEKDFRCFKSLRKQDIFETIFVFSWFVAERRKFFIARIS